MAKRIVEYRPYYRRHLPHWQPPGATLFVTFRLAGSLPRTALEELEANARQREAALLRVESESERERLADEESRRAFGRWDAALDRAQSGPRWLAIPGVADVVAEAMHYRDGRVYDLVAFCIMPNHVHLVCTPPARENDDYHPLHKILHSLQRHTARQANQILGREGAFWQDESYDHVVRDEKELERIVEYVINNPVKAGLVDDSSLWPWTYCSADWQSALRAVGRIGNPPYLG